jgi:hypothetical protein
MKKRLFAVLAMVQICMAVAAQEKVNYSTCISTDEPSVCLGVQSESMPRKSKSNGVYYLRPTGTYYRGLANYSWATYYTSMLVTPARTDVQFRNKCTDASAAVWSFDANDATQRIEDNQLIANCPVGTNVPAPFISIAGKDTFQLGEEETDYATYGSRVVCPDDFISLSLTDLTVHMYSTGKTSPLFGTKAVYPYDHDNDGTKENYYNTGIYQFYPQPITPLCIKDIQIPVWTTTDFLSSGKSLTIKLRSVTIQNNVPNMDKTVLATFTCNAEGIRNISSESTSGRKFACIVFTPVDADSVVLNQPFALSLTGFLDSGVEVAVAGSLCPTYDVADNGYTYMTLRDANGKDMDWSLRNTNYHAVICFEGIFDNVAVSDEGNCNLLMTADGQKCIVKGNDSQTGTPVYTTMAWKNSAGKNNYTLVGKPDWITDVVVDESLRKKSGSLGMDIISFKGEPIPSGMAQRTATLYIQGKGVTSSKAITVVQGASLTGIQAVNVAPSSAVTLPSYNVLGQRVGANAKGLVIRNGKKTVNH